VIVSRPPQKRLFRASPIMTQSRPDLQCWTKIQPTKDLGEAAHDDVRHDHAMLTLDEARPPHPLIGAVRATLCAPCRLACRVW